MGTTVCVVLAGHSRGPILSPALTQQFLMETASRSSQAPFNAVMPSRSEIFLASSHAVAVSDASICCRMVLHIAVWNMAFTFRKIPMSQGCKTDVVFGGRNSTRMLDSPSTRQWAEQLSASRSSSSSSSSQVFVPLLQESFPNDAGHTRVGVGFIGNWRGDVLETARNLGFSDHEQLLLFAGHTAGKQCGDPTQTRLQTVARAASALK